MLMGRKKNVRNRWGETGSKMKVGGACSLKDINNLL